MLRVGVFGYGYWGPNLVRNISQLDHAVVTHVADPDRKRLALVQKTYPAIIATESSTKVIEDPNVDAVVIAAPLSQHYALARNALLNGKHVLIEKPMTASVREAEDLIEIAVRNDRTLMVDHTFLYTGAVKKIRSLISSGQIGEIRYFDSTRINLGLFQEDHNVVWDLVIHDLSILLHVIPQKPCGVLARGLSHAKQGIEDIAYVVLTYENAMIGHCSASWISPVKVRKILIGGDKKMIVYDDVEPTEKLKVYDAGFHVNEVEEKHRLLVDYRFGDIHVPKLETKEALRSLAEDFVGSIEKKTEPLSNWKHGVEVVRILEAASRSIQSGGKEVPIHLTVS